LNKQIKLSWADKLVATGLIIAATGILLQISAGVASPAVPVGAIILLAVVGLIVARVWSWASTLGGILPIFILIGAFIAPGLGTRLSNPSNLGPFVGTVLQMSGLILAIIAGAIATFRHSTRQGSLLTPDLNKINKI
jgi:hypothetical protein